MASGVSDGRAMLHEPVLGTVELESALPSRRVPLPMAGILVFAALRLLSLALTWFLLRHGSFAARHWSLKNWMTSWDGRFYLQVASLGYRHSASFPLPFGTNYDFFPGYPAAIAMLDWLPKVSAAVAGISITMAAGLVTAWGLTRLGMRLTGNGRISLVMVALWACAPGAEVLSMTYPEALYCALAVWALLALLERRWLTVGLLTAVTGTVSHDAVELICAVWIAAGVEVIRLARADGRLANWWRPVAAMVAAPVGLVAFLGAVALWTGRLDGWFWIQSAVWHQHFDWGRSSLRMFEHVVVGRSGLGVALIVATVIVPLIMAAWALTEPVPAFLKVYTALAVVLTFGMNDAVYSDKPRLMLPIVLLALPLARLFATLRLHVLVPLLGLLAVASTWGAMYLTVIAKMAP